MAAPDRTKEATLNLVIDRSSPVPLYFQIAEQFRRQIEEGRLEPRTMLGNEIQLAEQLAVSRPTLRKALEELVEQGLLARRRGVGTVVVPQRLTRRVAVPSLYDDLKSAGRSPSTKVLRIRQEVAPAEVAAAFELPDGTEVISVSRLRLADGSPLAVMQNYIPTGLAGSISERDLSQRGLYEAMRTVGIEPHLVSQTVGARTVTSREARLLGLRRSAPVLVVTALAFDYAGHPVDFGMHSYRADRYSFEIRHVLQ